LIVFGMRLQGIANAHVLLYVLATAGSIML
jgi:hypothetical protein